MLKRTKIEKELRGVKRGVLNIQLLAVRSLSHSSCLECGKGKSYNVKMQFVQMIIQDINTTRTSIVQFLRRSR